MTSTSSNDAVVAALQRALPAGFALHGGELELHEVAIGPVLAALVATGVLTAVAALFGMAWIGVVMIPVVLVVTTGRRSIGVNAEGRLFVDVVWFGRVRHRAFEAPLKDIARFDLVDVNEGRSTRRRCAAVRRDGRITVVRWLGHDEIITGRATTFVDAAHRAARSLDHVER